MSSVSVLIPCYQAEETLLEALDSLASQTMTDFEIVAVDDGSSDATASLLAQRAKIEPRLRVVHLSHSGVVTALNTGLSFCHSPLVARMDADDRCHPRRLEAQFAHMQNHPEVSVLGCQVRAFPERDVQDGMRTYLTWQNALLSDTDIRREIFIESPFAHPSVMFRKQDVFDAGGYEEHGWAEDYDLWLRMYSRGAVFAKLPEVLVDWREHHARLTRQDARYSAENFMRAKAYYLLKGPLRNTEAVMIWGAGRIGKHTGRLLENDAPLKAYIDVDPQKIGQTRRGLPVLAPAQLVDFRKQWQRSMLLVAVGVRGARELIREQLSQMGLEEGVDWLAVV